MYKRASVADYISPDNGHRGRMERHGHQPKNHMKDNYQNLKTTQEKNRMKREDETNANPKDLYKLSQFRDVGARVFEPVPSNSSGRNLSENHEGVFLVRGAAERRREELAEEGRLRRKQVEDSLNEAKMFSDHQPPSGSSSPRKRSVPRADEMLISSNANKPPTDFIHRNKKTQVMDRKNSSEVASNRGDSAGSDSRHESYGRVPGYLVNRKNEWAELEEERRRNAPDPSCPRGMCLMPEEERQATLATLFESRQECLRQLERMPFVIETPSAKRRVEELEKKLREIEKAIEIFNKPKVYVAK
jgi:hypothetical protein